MRKEFYTLSKSIANLPRKVAMAAIDASSFPEGNPGDCISKKESKYALRERYWDWNERKKTFGTETKFQRQTA